MLLLWVFSEVTVFFFKGSHYYRYSLTSLESSQPWPLDEGYPKSIAGNWHGIPDDLDSATILPSREVYFFKGNRQMSKVLSFVFNLSSPWQWQIGMNGSNTFSLCGCVWIFVEGVTTDCQEDSDQRAKNIRNNHVGLGHPKPATAVLY